MESRCGASDYESLVVDIIARVSCEKQRMWSVGSHLILEKMIVGGKVWRKCPDVSRPIAHQNSHSLDQGLSFTCKYTFSAAVQSSHVH